MGTFRWLSGPTIPPAYDLRSQGWSLIGADQPVDNCLELLDSCAMGGLEWVRVLGAHRREARRLVLACGVDKAEDRAALLDFGLGDCVDSRVTPTELVARARRLLAGASWVPRRRLLERLELDLLAREALVDGRAIDLNAREFAILWRLADAPGEPVHKHVLLSDIWRLGYVPETNNIAVHMSRLRGKLAVFGLPAVIETVGPAYRLTAGAAEGTIPSLHVSRTPMGQAAQPALATSAKSVRSH